MLRSLPLDMLEMVSLTSEVIALRDAYLDAGVVTARWMDDATHVAAATVFQADAIVSWNFRHIVRLDKMKAYNRINQEKGYPILTIITPAEAVGDEDVSEEQDI